MSAPSPPQPEREQAGPDAVRAAGPSPLPGAPPVAGEMMDRLSRHLAQAGFRLAHLRRQLPAVEDQMMADQVSSELDEAIAQVRRLALAMREML